MRVFAALYPDKALEASLKKIIDDLNDTHPGLLRFSPVHYWHVTLQFFGENLEENKISLLNEALEDIASGINPFPVSLASLSLGFYPHDNRRATPLVLNALTDFDLPFLSYQIKTMAQVLNIPVQTKPFIPHITLGRIRKNLTEDEAHGIRKYLSKFVFSYHFWVKEFKLISSTIKPTGAQHNTLSTIKLS
jgi:RNA 2',3'-cyclic 3'-phosphodiesterase